MSSAAFHGLVGDVVRLYDPCTEADPHALLLVFHVMFGCFVGFRPHYVTDGQRQGTNLFAVLVGKTSRGRKGSASRRIRNLFMLAMGMAAEAYLADHVMAGLSSGEGLVHKIRDPREDDPGVLEKSLLVDGAEFGQILAVLRREGNTLSPVLRCAFDRDLLQFGAKSNQDRATDPHVAVLEQITQEELNEKAEQGDIWNGLLNRFLFCLCSRSKKLPVTPEVDVKAEAELAQRICAALTAGYSAGRFEMDPEAAREYAEFYNNVPDAPGLIGALTCRTEPLVCRLSLLYALEDSCTGLIHAPHLRAAIEVVRYCEESVRHIFADFSRFGLGNRILEKLLEAGKTGLTQSEISERLSHHKKAAEINGALSTLESSGKVLGIDEPTGGRKAKRWFAIEYSPLFANSLNSHPPGVLH
jgi:hypothetical protein